MIEVTSLIFFIMSVILVWDKKSLPVFFPIILLVYPNSLDNFLPGVLLNFPFVVNNEPYQIIRFIDLILILVFINLNLKIRNNLNGTVLFLIYCLIFLIVPLLLQFHKHIFSIFFVLINIFRLIIIHKIVKHIYFNSVKINKLYLGIALGASFIIFESILFTFISESSKLVSGNYANNTLGAVLSILLMVLVVARTEKTISRIYFIPIIIIFCGLIYTGARMGIFAFIFFSALYYIRKKNILYFVGKAFPAILLLVFTATIILKFNPIIYQKFSLTNLPSANTINSLNIERWGEFGSLNTIVYRLYLWKATISMTVDNWFFGIGMNAWDFERWSYGITQPFRLDAHNTFLQLISEFGLIIGLVIIYLIIKLIINSNKIGDSLCSIHYGLLVFFLTQLTNYSILRINFFMFSVFLFSLVANAKKQKYIYKIN